MTHLMAVAFSIRLVPKRPSGQLLLTVLLLVSCAASADPTASFQQSQFGPDQRRDLADVTASQPDVENSNQESRGSQTVQQTNKVAAALEHTADTSPPHKTCSKSSPLEDLTYHTQNVKDQLSSLVNGQKTEEGESKKQTEDHHDKIKANGAHTGRAGVLTSLGRVHQRLVRYVDGRSGEVGRSFSNNALSFPSLEAALLSLAFLTFVVFLIDLVQDLLNGTSGRRRRRATEGEVGEDRDAMTDLILLSLSSLDTLSFGREHPACGQRLLCHLNRSGWHDGILGTASNYFVSLVLSVLSPSSGFEKNLEAANFGRESEKCSDRYTSCPSVMGGFLPIETPRPHHQQNP